MVVKHPNRLLRKVDESPCLQVSKRCTCGPQRHGFLVALPVLGKWCDLILKIISTLNKVCDSAHSANSAC